MKKIKNSLKLYLYKILVLPAFLYGLLITSTGFLYTLGILFSFLRIFFDPDGQFLWIIDRMIWYSGIPVVAGFILILIDLFVLLPRKRVKNEMRWCPPKNSLLTVVLTAYNDESSIGLAVKDFSRHPQAKRVIVVDNNSDDQTSEVAIQAGAKVIREHQQGFIAFGVLLMKAVFMMILS